LGLKYLPNTRRLLQILATIEPNIMKPSIIKIIPVKNDHTPEAQTSNQPLYHA